MSFVRRSQNGAAKLGDTDRIVRCEFDIIPPIRKQAFEAIDESKNFPAQLVCCSYDAIDDGV